MINSWKNLCLDNISFTSGDNFTHNFPAHFHEEYTIGVSINGIQRFELLGDSFIVQPHSIFLIKPYQIHAHFPIAEIGWSFKSLYLSPDLIAHLTNGQNIDTAPTLLQNKELFTQFLRLHRKPQDESLLKDFIHLLADHKAMPEANSTTSEKITAIKRHLSHHLDEKLNLDNLAKTYKSDKYQLIRQFKQTVGVTPNTYLTILRIEKARRLLNTGYTIVEAALEAGFYDQAHFHHNFVRYTGVTPGKFATSLHS